MMAKLSGDGARLNEADGCGDASFSDGNPALRR
jgi:hypothetical protein